MYVAVQGQKQSNKFKLSMWDDLFTRDTYVTSVKEEENPSLTVLDQKLSTSSYRCETFHYGEGRSGYCLAKTKDWVGRVLPSNGFYSVLFQLTTTSADHQE